MKSASNRTACLIALLCACLLGTTCQQRAPSSTHDTKPAQENTSRPARIISLSPNATEILYGVGAFDRVVAVSDYCTYPPEVNRLPRVGGWNNPNLEQIASLRPELVVFAEAQAQFVKDKLEAMSIRTLSVPSLTLEDAFAAIEQIGHATGNEAEARELLACTHATLDDVRARTQNLPRRRVLCVVDRVPGTLRDLYTASQGSFITQLIEAAGGESVAPQAAGGFGKIQKEAVVALDPDIIVDLMMQKTEGQLAEDTQAVWRELPALRAVREGRVYPMRDTSLLHPSQFIGDTARKFAEIIHPEAFKDQSRRAERKSQRSIAFFPLRLFAFA